MAKNAKSEHSWERQPGETTQAFEAFELYCELGEERSIRKVGQKSGKNDSLISRWSSRWNWVNRARDYDNEKKRQELQAEKKAYRAMRDRQLGIAIQFQKKAFDALQNLKIEAMTPKDIKEFMKLGAEIERANINISVMEESNGDGDDTTVDIYLPEKDGEQQ